jgi:hypothetical protein
LQVWRLAYLISPPVKALEQQRDDRQRECSDLDQHLIWST